MISLGNLSTSPRGRAVLAGWDARRLLANEREANGAFAKPALRKRLICQTRDADRPPRQRPKGWHEKWPIFAAAFAKRVLGFVYQIRPAGFAK